MVLGGGGGGGNFCLSVETFNRPICIYIFIFIYIYLFIYLSLFIYSLINLFINLFIYINFFIFLFIYLLLFIIYLFIHSFRAYLFIAFQSGSEDLFVICYFLFACHHLPFPPPELRSCSQLRPPPKCIFLRGGGGRGITLKKVLISNPNPITCMCNPLTHCSQNVCCNRLLEADSKSLKSIVESVRTRRGSNSSQQSTSSSTSNLSNQALNSSGGGGSAGGGGGGGGGGEDTEGMSAQDQWLVWGKIVNDWEEFSRKKTKQLKVMLCRILLLFKNY